MPPLRSAQIGSSDTEEEWMHETQDVERHLLCRESADAIALKFMCNNIGCIHQTGTTSPANEQQLVLVHME